MRLSENSYAAVDHRNDDGKGVSDTSATLEEDFDADSDFSAPTKPSSIRTTMQQKLYGRQPQIQQLFKIFKRCATSDVDEGDNNATSRQKGELSIIMGKSGSGKSALAKTLQQHADYFLMGKCDQIQQGSEPFKPFISAFSQLVDEVLRCEDPNTIQHIKSTIQHAIQEETEVNLLADMTPALSGLFPKRSHANAQPDSASNATSLVPVTAFPPTATLHRAEGESPTVKVVCKFLHAMSSIGQSIVIVVDDVQWIDSSSLQLLQSIVVTSSENPMKGLMLLATCRDDEVPDEHSFSQALRHLSEANEGNVLLNYISVGDLSVEDIHELASDVFPTLHGKGLGSLSAIIHQHTKGNAFFATQIMQKLLASGWKASPTSTIQQGAVQEREEDDDFDWSFNEDNRSIVDNLVSLDCDKLVDFVVADAASESTIVKDVLKASSCLGSDFVLSHVMAVIHDAPQEHILEALDFIEERGYISRRTGQHDDDEGGSWSWAHDKYQQAAYFLIGAEERKAFHLKVGRNLLQRLSKEGLQQHIFIVVSQFCIAKKLIEADEAEDVIDLLLLAGERSAQSSSFSAAASYFALGMSLLKADNWTSQYRLSFRLYNAAAGNEYSLGKFNESDKLVNVILRHTTHSLQDQIQAYETKICLLSARQELMQAINLALDVFAQLGEQFPRKKPGMAMILYEVATAKWLLSRKTEDEIMNLEPMNDWKKNAVIRIMKVVFSPVLRTCPELATIIACRCVKITLKFGICGMSCASFGAFGMVLAHPLGYIDEANKCARISQRIVDEYNVTNMKCLIYVAIHGYCYPYKAPLQNMLEPVERAAPLGFFLTGDREFGSLSYIMHVMFIFFCGWKLSHVLSLAKVYMGHHRKWDDQRHSLITYLLTEQQMIENLVQATGTITDPCTFAGSFLNEKEWETTARGKRDEPEYVSLFLCKSLVGLYLGEYAKAREFTKTMMKYNLAVNAGWLFQIYFVDALVDLLAARKKAKRYKSSLKKLQFYSKHCPENVCNKIYLIEAEQGIILNMSKKHIIEKFQLSIHHAHEQKLIHEEALAYERYGVAFIEEWDDNTRGLKYLQKSKSLYEQWGSLAKVRQLEIYIMMMRRSE